MLKTNLLGVTMKNPVIAASGTFGFGREYAQYMDISKLGGISTKGLTLEPRFGNKGRRVHETPAGMLNSVGLQNPGVEAFIKEELADLKATGTTVVCNLGGSDLNSYLTAAEMLDETDIDILELNISCPNVKAGGMAFGIKCESADTIVRAIRKVTSKPLLVKLSPNAEDIIAMAKTCEAAGADGLSLINTLSGMAIDIHTQKPVFENTIAGLSGPAVFPVALRMTYQVCGAVDIPVVGMGGISSAEDAIAFILAGATAIQVGTANFVKPDICLDIIAGMEQYLQDTGAKSLSEIRGNAQPQ